MRTINSKAFLETFQAHLLESALAQATVVNYLADLRAFLRWGEEVKGTDASPFDWGAPDVKAYCLHLQAENHAPATINRRLQALRKFYGLAVERGWIKENPADEVALLGEVVSERSRSLTPSDVARLLAAARRTRPRYQDRDWAVVQVFLRAGLKLTELTELRLSDAQLGEDPCLRVRGAEGQADRSVPLDSELSAALQDYVRARRALQGVEHLFVNRDGNPLSTRSVQRLLHHLAEAAHLDRLTTQSLRYVYAIKAYEDSDDLETVARLLGHRHLATTIRYLRPPASPLRGGGPGEQPLTESVDSAGRIGDASSRGHADCDSPAEPEK